MTREARVAGVRGQVLLRLTVQEDGRVGDVEVERSLGHGLDESALLAARALLFSPAERGGIPVAARILFAYQFDATGSSKSAPQTSLQVGEGSEQKERPALPEGDDEDELKEETPTRGQEQDLSVSNETTHPQEVTVLGRSLVSRLRRSPYAVRVIELEEAGSESSDMAQVLDRSASVNVQRRGALGSRARLTMAGLSGEQVRVFVDGIPLAYAGYVMGVENVPVNLIDRVEIYEGVVPIELGADALGGAIQLVSHENLSDSRAAASYQAGSFHTHRLTGNAQHFFAQKGLGLRLSGYLDTAENDYDVDVPVWGEGGRVEERSLPRFHDGYFATGGRLSLYQLDESTGDRWVLSGFFSSSEREIQNNPSMETPYGEVTFGKFTTGAVLHRAMTVSDTGRLEGSLGYSYVSTRFVDVSACLYDWRGECTLRNVRGEITQSPFDRALSDHVAFARLDFGVELLPGHTWRVSLAPTWAGRVGEDREKTGQEYDHLEDPQTVGSLVSGAELSSSFADDQLKNVLFFKSYGQIARGRDMIATGEVVATQRSYFHFGGGDAIRYFLSDELYLKTSYEYATRLPGPDELFGDGGIIERNLELVPERSHNLNLGMFLEDWSVHGSTVSASLGTFARFSDDLILLNPGPDFQQYKNVRKARSLGGEAQFELSWFADAVRTGLAATVMDLRNRSTSGPQAEFFGDRIPNRSPLTATGHLTLRASSITSAADSLQLTLRSRYAHGFYRTWASSGAESTKARVDSQFSHDVGLLYEANGRGRKFTASLEVQNVTDAKLSDYFGVQRPGRAVFFKCTLLAL